MIRKDIQKKIIRALKEQTRALNKNWCLLEFYIVEKIIKQILEETK